MYKVLAAMPPESVQRLRQELHICCTEKLGQLALAQTSMTKSNSKQRRRRWLAFKDFIAREVPKAVPGEIPLKTTEWLTTLGASLTSPDSLDTEDLCSTCRQTGPWIA